MSQVNITSGPSQSDFLGTLSAPDYSGTVVTFTTSDGSQEVDINQIQREDGSGSSFNFWNLNDAGGNQTGYYDTATGTGWLNVG